MEQNFVRNNIENENIIQNNLNNNENIENQNNNIQIRYNNILNKFKNVTISFLIFFIINIMIYLYSKIIPLKTYKYVFQYVPIVKKFQFYRIITRYFIHFGVFHLIIELITFFYLCKIFENIFGTILTLSIIFISMILDSLIQLLIIPTFSFFLRGRISILYNYFYEGGLTPILFTLLTYFSLYRRNKNQQISLESLFILRVKYLYLYFLGLLYFFTPNRTFYGNISGIIGGFILKNYSKFLLPRIIWIKELEENYSLNKIKLFYRFINLNNNKMKEILNEYDRDSIEDIIESNKIDEKKNVKTNIEFHDIEENNYIGP